MGRRRRRSNASIIRGSLVVGCEGFQDLGDPSAEAHGAATHPRRVVGFERLLQRFAEHLVVVDGREPIRCRRGEVVTRAEAATFDKRPDAELLQARAGRD